MGLWRPGSVLFTGHSEHAIDSKLRLAIPAKYRSQWDPARDGMAWFCVPWPGGILRLYTERTFQDLAERGSGQHSLTPGEEEADLEADLYGFAERLEMDAAGRVTLPKSHLELTGLSNEVVIVGARNRLEIRDRAKWVESTKDRFAKLPALVARIEAKKGRTGN
jgi:MraZ protein